MERVKSMFLSFYFLALARCTNLKTPQQTADYALNSELPALVVGGNLANQRVVVAKIKNSTDQADKSLEIVKDSFRQAEEAKQQVLQETKDYQEEVKQIIAGRQQIINSDAKNITAITDIQTEELKALINENFAIMLSEINDKNTNFAIGLGKRLDKTQEMLKEVIQSITKTRDGLIDLKENVEVQQKKQQATNEALLKMITSLRQDRENQIKKTAKSEERASLLLKILVVLLVALLVVFGLKGLFSLKNIFKSF